MANKKGKKIDRSASWAKVQLRSVSWLKDNPANARKHSDSQVEYVASLIKRFGWKTPILCDSTGVIIAGHCRKLAAKLLGLETVPVMIDETLSAEEREAYAIADNQSALLSSWDKSALKEAVEKLSESSFDLSMLGFSDVELSSLIGRDQSSDPDAIPVVRKGKVSIRNGDVFDLGKHRILCADSTKLKKQSIGNVQCVWTDPPYGVSYQGGSILNDSLGDQEFVAFLSPVMALCASVLAPGCPVYVCHAGTRVESFMSAWRSAGLTMSGVLIWKKNHFVIGRMDWQSQHEPILYGWRPGAAHRWYGGRKMTSILEFAGASFTQIGDDEWSILSESGPLVISGKSLSVRHEFTDIIPVDKPSRNEGHPTVKPTVLIERCLLPSTKQGDTVFDPFSGSGSTIIACEVIGRRAVGVELDPSHVELTIARWETLTGKKAKRSKV